MGYGTVLLLLRKVFLFLFDRSMLVFNILLLYEFVVSRWKYIHGIFLIKISKCAKKGSTIDSKNNIKKSLTLVVSDENTSLELMDNIFSSFLTICLLISAGLVYWHIINNLYNYWDIKFWSLVIQINRLTSSLEIFVLTI